VVALRECRGLSGRGQAVRRNWQGSNEGSSFMPVDVESLFKKVVVDPQKLQGLRNRPKARTVLAIFFTPRSGSSWLTDALSQTNRLGRANEAFNPNFIPNLAQSCNATSLDSYIDLIQRRFNTRNALSFEITWHQLRAVFRKPDAFMAHFGEARNAWLIREDIVAQAVSLAKMVTTNVAHSPWATDEDRARAEQAFVYDADLIRHWLNHILIAERHTEAHFAAKGIEPLRLCYEDMMSDGAAATIAKVAQFMGVPDIPQAAPEPRHSKLGTSQNADYAARFREQERAFLARVDDERRPWLHAYHSQKNHSPSGHLPRSPQSIHATVRQSGESDMSSHYDIYTRAEKIAGWLNKPAAYLTVDLLRWQEQNAIKGGVVEIGVFCGKYFSILADSAFREKSPLLGVDTFQYTNQKRVYTELEGVFGRNVEADVPLWKKSSLELRPGMIEKATGKCRFISIDGAHDYETVFRDLVLCEQVLANGGIIAADDFLNPVAMGVNQAINTFLSQPRAVVPVAYTANKLFLANRVRAEEYRTVIEEIFERGDEPFADHFRKQRSHGRHHIEQMFHGSRVLLR
jgi:LPS sulfotransferase NodH